MADKMDLLFLGPFPFHVFLWILREQDRTLSVCGCCSLWTLIAGVLARDPVEVMAIIDVQVIAFLHFLVGGIVSNESGSVSTEICALECQTQHTSHMLIPCIAHMHAPSWKKVVRLS